MLSEVFVVHGLHAPFTLRMRVRSVNRVELDQGVGLGLGLGLRAKG